MNSLMEQADSFLLRQSLNKLQAGLILIDSQFRVLHWNAWVAGVSQITPESAIGSRLQGLFGFDENNYLIQRARQTLTKGLTSFLSNTLSPYVFPLYEPGRSKEKIRQKVMLLPIRYENQSYCLIHIQDVTDAWKREQVLIRKSHQLEGALGALNAVDRRLRSVYELSPDAILVVSETGELESSNIAARKIFAIGSQDTVYIQSLIEELNSTELLFDQFSNFGLLNGSRNGPIELNGCRGVVKARFPVELDVVNIGEITPLFCVVCRDITHRKEIEEQLIFMARYDHLTGLANRMLFNATLEQGLKKAIRYNTTVALLYIDLDNLKPINDQLGHDAGDALIQAAADRLVSCMRGEDMVARLGGDEFGIMIEQGWDETHNLSRILERLYEELEPDIEIQGKLYSISASIGVVVGQSETAEELLKYADMAMYRAKAAGRHTYRFYSPEDKELSALELIQQQMSTAVRREQLMLLYQPVMNLKGASLEMLEAFLRWQHPGQAPLNPPDFMPAIIQSGYQELIDEWVLTTAMEQRQRWLAAGDISERLVLSLNMPSVSLMGSSLIKMLERCLHNTSCPAECIMIEVTEAQILKAGPRATEVLAEVAKLGVKLAIDDFGNGLGSLQLLSQLPIDRLKIDRSLVSAMTDDPRSQMVVRSIVQIAHTMGMQVVAEGVEKFETLGLLNEVGCDSFQGYLCSEPITALKLPEFLRQTRLDKFMH